MVIDPLSRTVMRLGPDVGDASDGELLQCFANARDEQAFAALVRRHGPMVFGVCRRTLGHVHDAEDAFQATFLVLARKANAVRADGVSRWLYGVAVRVANKARVRRSRQTLTSIETEHVAARDVPPEADWLPLLDAILDKLPERDRDPILLCDVQGRSRAEAAAELGIAEGTLSSRLARAREKLRARLTLRGVTPSLAALTLGLTAEPVPARLLNSTLVNQVPTNLARHLAEGVIRNMILLNTCKIGLALTVVVGIGTVGFMQTTGNGADPQPAKKEAAKETPPAKETSRVPAKSDAERIRGTWMIESARRNGETSKDGVASWNGEEMTFDSESVKFSRFPGRKKHYKLDPGWDEKRIDFEFREVLDGAQRITVKVPAIYRFEGDKLHIVFGVVNLDERPDSFELRDKGVPFTHLILRRTKVAEEKDLLADERKALEGTWTSLAVRFNGERQEMHDIKLIFKGDRFTLRPKLPPGGGESQAMEGRYTLDLDPSPRHINLTLESGRAEWKGKVVQGIYALDRRVLTLCVDENGKGRPPNFQEASSPVMYFVPEGSDVKLPPNTPSAAQVKRLRDLQEARVTALKTQLQGQLERVKIGKDPLIQYIEAERELANAELELAGPAEQVAIVERMLKRLMVCEELMVNMQSAGLQTEQAVAQAKAARLKAEIELEKLKVAK